LAEAHNNLGFSLLREGRNEAALTCFQRAAQFKPDYADAHFNLAVIYATASPPSKERAKRHYVEAT